MRLPNATGLIRAGALIAALALAALSVAAMLRAGPWYDEFFTLHVTRAGQPFLAQFTQHWLADNHPPLFYALARATAWLGSEVEPRRLLNLAFLALAVAGLYGMTRRLGDGPLVAALTGLGLAGNIQIIDKAAEFRSTYLAMAAVAVAVAALAVLARPHARPARPRRDFWLVTAALVLALNVHFVTSVLVGAIALAFALRLALAGDRAGTLRIIAALAIAALPLLATTAIQLSRIEANTRSFWITGGLDAARWAIQGPVEMALAANWPIAVLGIAGIALMAAEAWHQRQAAEPLGIVIALAGGCVLGCAVLIGLHLWRPLLIERYLLPIAMPINLALALGAARALRQLPGLAATAAAVAILLAALLSLRMGFAEATNRPSWHGTGRAIAAMVKACPRTVVHANLSWNRPVMDMPPADNAAVMPEAYRIVARQFGFALEPSGSRRMAAHCPTVFWTEHVAALVPTASDVAMQLRNEGFTPDKTRLLRIGRGWILVSIPR